MTDPPSLSSAELSELERLVVPAGRRRPAQGRCVRHSRARQVPTGEPAVQHERDSHAFDSGYIYMWFLGGLLK